LFQLEGELYEFQTHDDKKFVFDIEKEV